MGEPHDVEPWPPKLVVRTQEARPGEIGGRFRQLAAVVRRGAHGKEHFIEQRLDMEIRIVSAAVADREIDVVTGEIGERVRRQ